MSKREDICVGYTFGRLTVIEDLGMLLPRETSKQKKRFYLCRCECGNEKRIVRSSILNNMTLSCGCLQKEKAIITLNTINEKVKTGESKHGFSKYEKEYNSTSRLYSIYRNMKERCYNVNNGAYQDYGGRGITICNEWNNDYQIFMDWSIENGYSDDLSIDRIDVNGNYEPSNCRWATIKEQANNKRTTLCVEYNGKTKTLLEWSNELGINYDTLRSRIFRRKMTPKEAFETKIIERKVIK